MNAKCNFLIKDEGLFIKFKFLVFSFRILDISGRLLSIYAMFPGRQIYDHGKDLGISIPVLAGWITDLPEECHDDESFGRPEDRENKPWCDSV